MKAKRDWTIAAIFILIVILAGYVWAYKARCMRIDRFLDRKTNDTAARRVYGSEFERIIFLPAASVETLFSHDPIRTKNAWHKGDHPGDD